MCTIVLPTILPRDRSGQGAGAGASHGKAGRRRSGTAPGRLAAHAATDGSSRDSARPAAYGELTDAAEGSSLKSMKHAHPQPARRWIRWIVLSPIILLAVVVLWGFLDANGGTGAAGMWNHRWNSANGEQVGGYLIRPDQARRYVERPATGTLIGAEPSPNGRMPAVLMLHEWWGLTLETSAMAEQLAADGYIVLAPDLFRGRRSVSVPGALVQMVLTPDSQVRADVDRALTELRELPQVDPDRIGVVGFCFGGTQAMHLGARSADPEAFAILYGNGPITEEEELGALGTGGAVLGIYGAQDQTIPLEEVRQFESILEDAERNATISIYEGVGHAFVSLETIRNDETAAAAWDEVRQFLMAEL